MAKFRKHQYVDENHDIVTVIEIIQTPAEFLRENGEVWNYAEAMKSMPGLTNTKLLE